MRLKVNQLQTYLERKLAPVYLISGDEPLQLQEASDAVRLAAKKSGYENREVFSVDVNFNWTELLESASSLSIFSDRKIIDLRIPSAKPGAEGAKFLVKYCEAPPPDTLLLITTGKINKASEKANWFQALEKAGVIVQTWPLSGRDFMQWLQQRMQNKGLQADQPVLKLFMSRVEGNLLAAAQEVEKLYVLYGTKHLTEQDISNAVIDNSRYDVFNLIDSLLVANTQRAIKILHDLKAEGVAEPIILWAFSREARTLVEIKIALSFGERRDGLFKKKQVWGSRQKLVSMALQRLTLLELETILLLAAEADRQIKGEQDGDVWITFEKICLVFLGAKFNQVIVKEAI